MDRGTFKGKTVLVMGLGQFEGGLDSVIFAHNCGAKVVVTDLADEKKLEKSLDKLKEYDGIEYHLGGHRREDFEADSDVDIVIVNPAVPPENPFVQTAQQAGKLITSQVEIFFQLCRSRIIGITGSDGKSTTTSLIAAMLTAGAGQAVAGFNKVWLGGNIGNNPLLSKIEQIRPDDLVVLELSSFQLEQLARIRTAPAVSVITNITLNHLDRHGTIANYALAKENIFKHQPSSKRMPAVSIFNAENELTFGWYEKYKEQAGRRCFAFSADDVPQTLRQKYALVGRANLSNLAAALKVAHFFGVSDGRIERTVADFKPLPHRLEFVAETSGVRWYNDSIATTPSRTMVALDAFEGSAILIAGGYDKKLPFDELGEKIAQSAKAVILIGTTAEKIAEAVRAAPKSDIPIEFASSLAEAVKIAAGIASAGDVVLLSPACASYDMFDNFRQRGDVFRRLAESLRK